MFDRSTVFKQSIIDNSFIIDISQLSSISSLFIHHYVKSTSQPQNWEQSGTCKWKVSHVAIVKNGTFVLMVELFRITRCGLTHFGLIVNRATYMMFGWPLNQTYYCILLSCVSGLHIKHFFYTIIWHHINTC